MECPMCKEQIREGARKCPRCGEMLSSVTRAGKWFTGIVSGSFSVAVALASLGFAYLEYQGRVVAVEEKELVQAEKEAAVEILQKIPAADLAAAVAETIQEIPDFEIVGSNGFQLLREGDLQRAQFEFTKDLKINPENFLATQGLLYTELLKGR
jgi:hypothetical protein